MKKKIVVLVALLWAIGGACMAQSVLQNVYRCYVYKDMQTWKQIIDSLEALPTLSEQQRAELLNAEYGYVAWRLSKDYQNKKEAEVYLNKAYNHLHALPKNEQNASLIAAYEGAFVGYQIGISPIKAPFIGMKSMRYVKEAVKKDSTNYFAYIQYGNVLYYMPAMFGGSRKEAVAMYSKAKELMETQQVHKQNWLYMNLLLTLADAYKKDHNWQQVKACYDEALTLQPNYPYITEKLYPTLQQNLEK
jgi:tetratricopeptide (TPR) repeat protein